MIRISAQDALVTEGAPQAEIEVGHGGSRSERMAFFDSAEEHTEYLAAAAGGALFLVKTEDKHIGRSLFGKQGRGELAVLERAVAGIEGMLGPEAVAHRSFIDVGANIGTTTIPAVLSYGFDSAVAIEPEPENARVLRLNIMLNELEERVDALPVAVSNEIGHADLVVTRDRAGKHWIATDRSMLKRKSDVLTVETVTLDHLVETGVIDPQRTGLLWMDAEAHEGHILEGASSLLECGTPLVLEWNPVILDRVGDRGKIERAVAANYTHFAAMHRDPDPLKPRFALQKAELLPAYAESFLDPSTELTKTDILVLRLDPDQAADIAKFESIVKDSSPTEEDGEAPAGEDSIRGGPISRIRDFFSRLRFR